MRWLTIFYDFRFKWTATAGIGTHPFKAWCHSWWISKTQSAREDTLEERYAIQLCFKLGKMSQKRMECFRLLFNYLAWVRKSEHQSWLAKGLGLGLLCWGFKRVQERFHRKRPALFKSGQWHFHQDNAPVHNSILVKDYFTKKGIKTVPQPPYSPNLAPCDFCLFPKLIGCRYETIGEMKEAVTKVIDTLTQEDFHGAFQKFLELYNKCIAAGGDYFEGD